MKSQKLLISAGLIISCWNTILAQDKEIIKQKEVIEIGYDQYTNFGYFTPTPPVAIDKTTTQPISSKDDAKKILIAIKDADLIKNADIKNWVKNWVDNTDKFQEQSTIVMIQHPLDLSKLYGDDNNAAIAKTNFTKYCKEVQTYQKILLSLEKAKTDIEFCISNKDQCIQCQSDLVANPKSKCPEIDLQDRINTFFVSKVKSYTEILTLIKSENELISNTIIKRDNAELSYNSYLQQFVEKATMQSFFLNVESGKWSNYSLNKKKILFVIVGGKKDFSTYKIKITKDKSYLMTGLTDLKDLAKSVGAIAFDAQNDCDNPKSDLRDSKIQISLLLLDEDQIQSPSQVNLNDNKDSTKYTFKIHEKSYWGIKVGVSFSNLDRKNFSLNSQNQVTVKLDTAQQKEWKSNLAAMIEFYPFGRDYDRLQPIWSSKQQTNFGDRIGIVAGMKIAKDPLQDIYTGFSIALSEDYSISFGLQFHSQTKDQLNLPVGINTSLDYLKNNLSREYKTIGFLNLSLNPAAVSKILGFKK